MGEQPCQQKILDEEETGASHPLARTVSRTHVHEVHSKFGRLTSPGKSTPLHLLALNPALQSRNLTDFMNPDKLCCMLR